MAEEAIRTRRLLFTRRAPPPPAPRAPEAHAVAHEQLAAERAEEDDALHHADEAGREVGALERVARVAEPADQERHEHDRERVVARERGDHDAGVAVARLLQPARVEQVAEVAVLARAADAGEQARTAPSRAGCCAACACPRSARRAASRRSRRPRSRSACARRAPRRRRRARPRRAGRTGSRGSCRGRTSATRRRRAAPCPAGNCSAPGDDVSRQYESVSKIR